MVKHLKTLALIGVLLHLSMELLATHNRAGEIIYEQLGPLTIRATIKTYTKASSVAADRDSLELNWGDGNFSILSRANGNGAGTLIPGTDIKINCYIGEHTYASRATYTLSFTDPNRVSGILNVNYPNSVDIPFYLETTFTLLNVQFQGLNNSVVLLEPPLDFACQDRRFIHNPNAYDSDGDSIAYELITPLRDKDDPVPNYQFPDLIKPGQNNSISLNAETGDFVWDAPQALGEYNIAIKISEYRSGQLISSTIRDMQIFVTDCQNDPPIIETITELCAIAGDLINIPIQVDDPNLGDLVRLNASGGPLLFTASPAILNAPTGLSPVPFDASLTWQTTCDQVQEQYYQIVIRADDTEGLSNLQTIRIKILAPPPTGLAVASVNIGNQLTWDSPYLCDSLSSANFLGFSIWRREGSNPFESIGCEHGLEGKGYQRIEYISNQVDNGVFVFTDNSIDVNTVYCYRVTALFSKLNSNQSPVNVVESIASDEVCSLALRDIPYITKATVDFTSASQGVTTVEWLLPDPIDYDTLSNQGPYRLSLLGGQATGSPIELASWSSTFFTELSTVSFLHENLNTLEAQYVYQVKLNSLSSQAESVSEPATTPFLGSTVTDSQVNLTWNVQVPWVNTSYIVYRLANNGVYQEIAVTDLPSYTDKNVVNNEEYCYKVETNGKFGVDPFPEPIINFSQEHCAIPIDNMPPCPPPLSLNSACQQLAENPQLEQYFNILEWSQNLIECPQNDDIADYTIYHSDSNIGEFEILTTTTEVDFEDNLSNIISGCYYVVANDLLGNVSLPSDTICADLCIIYELPNTFTPNADNANDVFKPRKELFVEEIDFKVYNKWGNLVFETTNPSILWDGTNFNGSPVDDGTYYYTCQVYQLNGIGLLEGTELLSGYIEVLR